MKLEYVPLLKTQRELYRLPRSRERFEAYLRTMVDERTGDLALPLSGMNPMASEHVPALLDTLLAIDADGIAAKALAEEAVRVRDSGGDFKVTLVVADDVRGQWTNRFTTEFGHRFESQALGRRGWLAGLLWASEPATMEAVRREVRMLVQRAAYLEKHGPAKTLGEMMAQEGEVMARLEVASPTWSAAETERIRKAVDPHRECRELPTVMACLFGDAAAEELGYEPLGLPERAGLELAVAEAEKESRRQTR